MSVSEHDELFLYRDPFQDPAWHQQPHPGPRYGQVDAERTHPRQADLPGNPGAHLSMRAHRHCLPHHCHGVCQWLHDLLQRASV